MGQCVDLVQGDFVFFAISSIREIKIKMGPLKGLVGILLIANVFGSKIIQNNRAAEAFSDETHEAVSANDRDEKFLSVFQIVKFKMMRVARTMETLVSVSLRPNVQPREVLPQEAALLLLVSVVCSPCLHAVEL